MWWLHAGAQRETVQIPPAVYKLPSWYSVSEGRAVAEALAALLPIQQPWVELPLSVLCKAQPAHEPHGVILACVRGGADKVPRCCGDARILLQGLPHVGPHELAWLAQLRERALGSLNLALSWRHHPLQLSGGGVFLVQMLAVRCADLAELLDLLRRAVEHRGELGGGDEPAWERSVAHAGGAHVAARLARMDSADALDALRVIVGVAEPENGVRAGERAGLLRLEGGRVRLLAVARGLMEGEARGGLLSEMGPLPEDLRRVLLPAPLTGPMPITMSAPVSYRSHCGLSRVMRVVVDGAVASPRERSLLEEGMSALEKSDLEAVWNPAARLPTWAGVLRSLDELATSGPAATCARALAAALRVASSSGPGSDSLRQEAIQVLRELAVLELGIQPVLRWVLFHHVRNKLHRPESAASLGEVDALLESWGEEPDLALAAELNDLKADRLAQRGEMDTALAVLREQLPVYEQLGDILSRAVTMGKIADILQSRGELEEAFRIRREEELPVFEHLGDIRSRAFTMGKIADILRSRGELDEALRILHEEELPVYEQLGDIRERAVTMGRIADILQSRGELDEALRIRREEELPVYLRFGDLRQRAGTLSKIADILRSRGGWDEALRIHREEALPVYVQLGDLRSRAVTLSKIADILKARGGLDEALRVHREESLPVYERLGDTHSRALTMGRIADILQSRGESDEALRIHREEELPVYEQFGDIRSRAVTMGKIADILQSRGESDAALRIIREEELPVYEQLGDIRLHALAMGRIADILHSRSELDESLRILREESLPVFKQLGDIRLIAVTLEKIGNILQFRGELEESLRIHREESLPVYERLGDKRSLLVGQANLAITLLKRKAPGDEVEAVRLLRLAHRSAEELRIPEADQILEILRQVPNYVAK